MVLFDLKEPYNVSEVKLSELGVTDIQYIPLQTDTNYILSSIQKLKVAESSFIIFDNSLQINRFGFDGMFINKIGKIGRGPGEFRAPSDFTIDNQNQRIFICPLENETQLYIYSLNGNYLYEIPCPNYTRKIYYSKMGILCWNDNMSGQKDVMDNLFLLDDKGNVIKKFVKKYNYSNTVFPNGFQEEFLMYEFNGNLYTKEIYSDTVFIFENDEFFPAFILDHGETTLSVEARERIVDEKTMKEVNTQYSKEINLFEFSNYVYSEFLYHDEGYGFIGSFDGEYKSFFNLEYGIINDIDNGPNIWFKSAKDNNTILSWINAFELKTHVASSEFKNSTPKYPEKKKALEQLANSLDENDNPVLMLVKLKE